MSESPRAALDVGSNTIRLLVARFHDGAVEPILDDSRFVRLGAGVDASGKLDPDRRAAGIEAIADLAAIARDAGAENIVAVATSAVRDATDGQDFVAEVEKRTGVVIRIIDGEEEARLTFLGATLNRDLSRGVLIVDMGGGSCEFIQAHASGIDWDRSLKIGSGRLTERFGKSDPPSEVDRATLCDFVSATLRESLPSSDAELLIFTGGTASHIQYLAGSRESSSRIDPEGIDKVETLVYSMPAAELAERHSIKPERAQVLPAGVTALRAIAAWSGAKELWISRQGIREGIIVDGAS